MTSLVLNFHNLKIFTCMHALNFRHNYIILNTKYKIQKGKKNVQLCNVLLIVFKGRVFISDHS